MNPGSGGGRKWHRYLRLWRPDVRHDVDEELGFHLEMRVGEYVARGMTREEAERAAFGRFGDVDRVKSICHDIDKSREREMRAIELLGVLRQDVRYGLRALRKSPGFTTVAVLSLALGIGANTAIFGLVDAVLLRPLAGVTQPDRMVEVREWNDRSYPSYEDLRRQTSDVFGGLAAFRERELSLGTAGTPLRVTGGVVSGNYFQVLGARPAMGRLLLPDDDRRGDGQPVVVLSHGLWRRAFAGDSGVLGRQVRLNDRPLTVVGIATPDFRGAYPIAAPELWIPMNTWPDVVAGSLSRLSIENRNWGWLSVIGRLGPGVTIAHAEAAVRAAARRIEEAHSQRGGDSGEPSLRPLAHAARGPDGLLGDLAIVLMTVVGLALLVACANLANLLLARAARRRREIGVRLALGASRGRLVRQMLTESAVTALLGGAAGVVVALAMTRLLLAYQPPAGMSLDFLDAGVTARMLAFTLLLSLATSMAFGLLPALRASSVDVSASLKEQGLADRGGRLGMRGALVLGQIAICLTLLAGTALLVRSLQQALRVDTGYDLDHIAIASIDLGLQRYDTVRARQFYAALSARLNALPGVRGASFAHTVPLSGDENVETLRIIGGLDSGNVSVSMNTVGAHYFRVVGLALVRGRDLDERDGPGAPPVTVVNESFARRFWPGQDALGKQIQPSGAPAVTVVGVARDAKYVQLGDRHEAHWYAPLAQVSGYAGLTEMAILVRASGRPEAVLDDVRREVRALDPALPVFRATTAADMLAAVLTPQRVSATLLGLFGALTLALAAVGIYGVLAYAVSQRTREIGIRVALGARPRDVIALVLGRMALLVAAGVALGLALALAASRAISALLFGVGAGDPPAFLAATVVLAGVALLASYVPARRAARVDPMRALRSE